MSIATKTGDSGSTGLMYNRRVPKTHPRVETYGSVDELNTAIGMARATAQHDFVRGRLLGVQNDLVILMGELATLMDTVLPANRSVGSFAVSASPGGQRG